MNQMEIEGLASTSGSRVCAIDGLCVVLSWRESPANEACRQLNGQSKKFIISSRDAENNKPLMGDLVSIFRVESLEKIHRYDHCTVTNHFTHAFAAAVRFCRVMIPSVT